MKLTQTTWIPEHAARFISGVSSKYSTLSTTELDLAILNLVHENRAIHEQACINLNPGTNVMNPRAEKLLGEGLGSRPSLGYPGDKYEMGLEAIEKIEIIAAGLACEIFEADFAEIRVGSGAMANLYAFMSTCQPGDTIIVPPASVGGHVTHHRPGAAGLYGVEVHTAPIDPDRYTIDLDQLREQALQLRPKLITVGGSLNLCHHPVRAMRDIADEVGAYLLFDAAHLSGMIAGKGWPNPLKEGAHLMTMSTYKSLGGPPSGLIVTNEAELAQRIDQIAFPGLTANFDASKSAALAMSLLDWREFGLPYAEMMANTATALAEELEQAGLPVFKTTKGHTMSHQFALEANRFGGGQSAAKRLRQGNILSCGIGLPLEPHPSEPNGLRLGTNEIARWGMRPEHMPQVAQFIAEVLLDKRPTAEVAADVTLFRAGFREYHFIRQ